MAACTLYPAEAHLDDRLHDPDRDPALGFHLVSWSNFGERGAAVWRAAVEDLHAYGFRHATFDAIRFVDPATGAVRATDGTNAGPELDHLLEAMGYARALGMRVSAIPFVEPDGFRFWRGELELTGAAGERFFRDYGAYVSELADVAEAAGAERLAIGTELERLVRAAEHGPRWAALIDEVGARFSGQLGYAANWDGYRDEQLTAVIWEHPRLDYLGVDAYFPLASAAQAVASEPFPHTPFIETIRRAWNEVLTGDASGTGDGGLLGFAAARKGGAGMPVVLTEHGLIPFDGATVRPYSDEPGRSGALPDADEALNGYAGLLASLAGRGARIHEITFWHWGMPGAEGSFWYQHPAAEDAPGTSGFDERLGRAAAGYLAGWVSGRTTLLDVPAAP